MRAVVIAKPGGVEVLQLREVSRPEPEAHEVLVRVRASALNRADILQRRGLYPAPPGAPPDIPGLEFAGEIHAIGSSVSLWKLGQRVIGLVGGGAHAEYLVAHERTVAETPSELSWPELAAIPEAFITAHDALWVQAGLRPGERVLIHAVASGVGLAAVQLSCAMNAFAFGTSRTADKLQRAMKFGLQSGFAVPTPPTSEDAERWKQTGGYQVVLDLAGGAYTNASIEALSSRGRIVLIGTMAGSKAEIDLGLVLRKRARIIGTALRARPIEEKIAVTRLFASEVLPFFNSGVLRSIVDSEFNMADIAEAHKRMESNETFGKVIIRVAD
jgi:NADPH2:quinone reductase